MLQPQMLFSQNGTLLGVAGVFHLMVRVIYTCQPRAPETTYAPEGGAGGDLVRGLSYGISHGTLLSRNCCSFFSFSS